MPYEKLEEVFFMWFMDMQVKSIPLTGEVVQQKARSFAYLLGYRELKVSPVWAPCFKKQDRIVEELLSGKSTSVSLTGAGKECLENMPEILGRCASEEMYNVDESDLFYQVLHA